MRRPSSPGLGDVATYGAYGDASGDISFLNHYFGGAAGTDAEAAMIEYLEADGAGPTSSRPTASSPRR